MKMRKTMVVVAALVALFAVAVPAQAQSTNTVSWRAQYYNNLFLSGATPAFETTVHNGLTLDFGNGSPDASIQADNFSGRFTADVNFPQGTYRFSIRADDEFQLRVNDNVVLSTMDAGQPNNILTVELAMNGSTHLQLDYRERTGGAYVSLNWQNVNATTVNIPTGTWLAEYFPNTTLSQPASAIFNEASPSHNWGFGAPVSSMPAEYWSARWRTSQYFAEGTYRFTASVDDDVRVYVDSTLIIDRFVESPGSTYTADVNLTAGNHVITVEYLELYNNAFIDFKIEQVGAAPSQPAPGSATLTISTGVLNVRNQPTAIGSLILTKVRIGETYAILGRNADSSWYKISANGVEGWVSAPFVRVNNPGSVGVTETTPTEVNPGDTIVSTGGVRVNLRSAPTTASTSLALVPTNTAVKVVGRNGDSSWFQVQYAGVTGWVSSAFVRSAAPLNYSAIPVTG